MQPLKKKSKFWLIGLVPIFTLAYIFWGLYQPEILQQRYTGYVVSNNLYLSTAVSGKILQVSVERGQAVEPGYVCFKMDDIKIKAQEAKALAQIKQYEAQKVMQAALLKSSEASQSAAQTEIVRTENDYNRYLRIRSSKPGAVSAQDLDHARLQAQKAKQLYEAAVREAEAVTANIVLAEAQINEAKAELQDIQKQWQDLSPVSPVEGIIEDVMFQPGEWASVNTPVVSIVPASGKKIRFFIPEAQIPQFPLNTKILFSTSSSPEPLQATINYIAPRPEYTPPVIYSLESRSKLMFLLEAVPNNPQNLIPGQPVDVYHVKPE